jgi:hypothetical protein
MKFSAVLLSAFGLGKAARYAEEQRASMAEVRAAAANVKKAGESVTAAVRAATDEAARFG